MRLETLYRQQQSGEPTHQEVAQLVAQLTRALSDGSACREVLVRMPAGERAMFERFTVEVRREREIRDADDFPERKPPRR